MDNPFKPKEVKLVNYHPEMYQEKKMNDIHDRKIQMYENMKRPNMPKKPNQMNIPNRMNNGFKNN